MYPLFMGTLNFLTLILAIDSTPSGVSPHLISISFHTSYFNDPWTLHSLIDFDEGHSPTGTKISLSATQSTYQATLDINVYPDPLILKTKEEDILMYPSWEATSS